MPITADLFANALLGLPVAGLFVRAVLATVPELTIHPPFTLSFSKPGNKVISQLMHRSQYCIPSEVADQLIGDPVLLLTTLNEIFGTHYSFQSLPALEPIMLYCTRQAYDFGLVYGLLRPWWSSIPDFPSLLSHFELLKRVDREHRESAIAGGLVNERLMRPRRVWDLYSNRVLPFWAINVQWDESGVAVLNRSREIQAVSHAWVSPEQRASVYTRINSYEWLVPIPEDIDLDDLRIELLNLRDTEKAGYAWLDVLCLRQEDRDSRREVLRKQEWKIDVPTIGTIYEHCELTIVYLNGLGRPFEENDLDSRRHWCNRAWTMQEWYCARGKHGSVSLGGITDQSPPFDISWLSLSRHDFAKQLCERMSPSNVHNCLHRIITAAAMMNRRMAEREVDRVAGLACFVCDKTQPVFNEQRDVDDAWLRLVICMTPIARGQLFFIFPVAGDHEHKWMPSWSQLLEGADTLVTNGRAGAPHLARVGGQHWPEPSVRPDDGYWVAQGDTQLPRSVSDYSCSVVCIHDCRLDGFDSSPVLGDRCKSRTGTMTFKVPPTDNNITFSMTAHHQTPIPGHRTYCMLSTFGSVEMWFNRVTCGYWVVGCLDEAEYFHKVSVLEIDDARRMIQALHLSPGDNECTSGWIRRVKLA